MHTIQSPHSLHQNHSTEQLLWPHDVIQKIGEVLENGNSYDSQLVERIEQLKQDIFSAREGIVELHNREAESLAQKQAHRSRDLERLQEELSNVSTILFPEIKDQEIMSSHQENILQLEHEIEQLKNSRSIRQNLSVQNQNHELTEALKELDQQKNKIAQLNSKTFQLELEQARQANRSEILNCQLTTLEETFQSLDAKQKYYQNQINLYTTKKNQKEAQRNKTREEFQEIQSNVNKLIEKKSSALEKILTEVNQSAINSINETNDEIERQLRNQQNAINKSLNKIHKSYEKGLKNYEEELSHYYQKIEEIRQSQLETAQETLDNYWRYVDEGTFRIFNTYQKEYLYAADYAPYDRDRRRVFTWIPGNPVTQGDWKLKQSSDGSFAIFNRKQGEYLYAADYDPYDKDRRRVFTWTPGNKVRQGYWELQPCGGNEYFIFNTHHQEYLYAADYAPYDKDRRHVFTWRSGNPVKQGTWKIIKID